MRNYKSVVYRTFRRIAIIAVTSASQLLVISVVQKMLSRALNKEEAIILLSAIVLTQAVSALNIYWYMNATEKEGGNNNG